MNKLLESCFLNDFILQGTSLGLSCSHTHARLCHRADLAQLGERKTEDLEVLWSIHRVSNVIISSIYIMAEVRSFEPKPGFSIANRGRFERWRPWFHQL